MDRRRPTVGDVRTDGARAWRRAAMLLGLVAWLVAGLVVDRSGLDWRASVALWVVIAAAIVVAGTLWLVPRSPRRHRPTTRG